MSARDINTGSCITGCKHLHFGFKMFGENTLEKTVNFVRYMMRKLSLERFIGFLNTSIKKIVKLGLNSLSGLFIKFRHGGTHL